MNPYGPVWFRVVLYGPVWSCMVPYGHNWSCIYKVIFLQRLSFIKESKVVFYQRSSSIHCCLLSKVIFNHRPSFIKGYYKLLSSIKVHQNGTIKNYIVIGQLKGDVARHRTSSPVLDIYSNSGSCSCGLDCTDRRVTVSSYLPKG